MKNNIKKSWFGNVGYYGVLLATLWAGNANADVKLGNLVSGSGMNLLRFTSTCPSGYVVTGCLSPLSGNGYTTPQMKVNSTSNPTQCIAELEVGNSFGDSSPPSISVQAICAKVCN
jgi:hypothetical protein